MVEEEGPLQSQACLEEVVVYHPARREGALGQAAQLVQELWMTLYCPHCGRWEEGEEEALSVLKTGSVQEMVVSH